MPLSSIYAENLLGLSPLFELGGQTWRNKQACAHTIAPAGTETSTIEVQVAICREKTGSRIPNPRPFPTIPKTPRY